MSAIQSHPYRTYAAYLRETFGQATRKISLHAGFSCPNRDGNISNRGCIFCEPKSFSPHVKESSIPLVHQLRQGIEQGHKRGIHCFVAYFQSFSNTYAPAKVLKDTYDTIRAFPEIKGLAIGTRPDCIDQSNLELINHYSSDFDVWIELGLQSIHDKTLKVINRGHHSQCFYDAVKLIHNYSKIKICAHVILGLPGENKDMESETAKALANLFIDGVKLHPLYVVEGTDLAHAYKQGNIDVLEQKDYLDRVINFLGYLPKTTVVQRVTADCPKDSLVAPSWLQDKNQFIQLLTKKMTSQNHIQGYLYPFA